MSRPIAKSDGKITKEEFVSANQDKKHKEIRFSSELTFGRFDRDSDGDLDDDDVTLFFEAFDKNGKCILCKLSLINPSMLQYTLWMIMTGQGS
jgi:hypothetical protein